MLPSESDRSESDPPNGKNANRRGNTSGRESGADWPTTGSEERYRQLFETSQEGIVLTTPTGEILDCNFALCELTGYDRKELIGSQASSLYDRQTHRELVRALQKEKQVRGLEVQLRHKSGEELICLISAVLWTDEKGEARAVQSCVRDVSKERRAQKALKESEEKFRTLTEKALVGIGLLRQDEYVYVNPELGQITGYDPEELVGKPPETIIHPGDRPLARTRIQQRIEGTRERDRYEARVLTKAGETRYVIIAGGRIEYKGEPAIIGTIQDITARRRMQREILQVQEAERRRIGKDLHDGVASELAGANVMLSTLATNAEREEVSGKEIARRLRQVQKLLQQSTGEVRRLSRGLDPAGIREGGLSSALNRLATNTEGVRFEAQGIEDSNQDLKGHGDIATHLYWIAREAVTNALKYSGAQEIAIRLRLEEGDLILEVQDEGKGFDPTDIGKEESLGLRSMRYRAELLGAELTIESSPGEGTLIRCRLPV